MRSLSQMMIAASTLTDTELGAIVGLTAFALFLVLFLIWFSLAKGKVTWSEITDAGVFTVAAQVAFSLVVICVVTLLMFAGTVQADAGLPILAGLAGVIVGKSRTATTVVAGTTGTPGQQGGAGTPGQQGGAGTPGQQGGGGVGETGELTTAQGA
jgi:hypothetical protein